MDQSFGNLGAGGSSSGGSNSAKAAAASSSFLQLPLSTAAAAGAASPAGVAYYGAPLALLHQAAGPSSSSQSPYGRHAAEISPAEAEAIKAKIVAHPQYSALLAAYLDCQKVGAFFSRLPACLLALACTHTSPHRRPSKSRFLSLMCRARFA